MSLKIFTLNHKKPFIKFFAILLLNAMKSLASTPPLLNTPAESTALTLEGQLDLPEIPTGTVVFINPQSEPILLPSEIIFVESYPLTPDDPLNNIVCVPDTGGTLY